MALRRRGAGQASTVYKLCSLLLQYPDEELFAAHGEIRDAVAGLPRSPAAEALERFLGWWGGTERRAVAQQQNALCDPFKFARDGGNPSQHRRRFSQQFPGRRLVAIPECRHILLHRQFVAGLRVPQRVKQQVGHLGHCRDYDGHRPPISLRCRDAGRNPNPVGASHRGAAELHYDQFAQRVTPLPFDVFSRTMRRTASIVPSSLRLLVSRNSASSA